MNEMVPCISLRLGFHFCYCVLPFQKSYTPRTLGPFQLPSGDFCFNWAAEEKALRWELVMGRWDTEEIPVPVLLFQVYAQNLSRLYDREIKAFFEQAKMLLLGRRKGSKWLSDVTFVLLSSNLFASRERSNHSPSRVLLCHELPSCPMARSAAGSRWQSWLWCAPGGVCVSHGPMYYSALFSCFSGL